MSYGNLLFYGGIAMAAVSVIALLIGSAAFGAKRKQLRKKLFDQYGF